jgi:hypothetical protein
MLDNEREILVELEIEELEKMAAPDDNIVWST